MSERPLAGRRIVVTRPRELAEGLAARIREAGGTPVLLPAIEIRALADPGPLRAVAARLEQFDWAIFVSPSAVRRAMALLRELRGASAWPPALRVAAIGRGSRRALLEEGFAAVLAPPGQADSEALLSLAEFARPAGQRCVIFRGRGGREVLGATLAARGARVEYAECYERVPPAPVRTPFGSDGAVDAVTVSSGEGLANLHAMLEEREREVLRGTALFVPHARIAEQAAALGARKVVLAGPDDAGMLAALVAYFRSAK